MTERRFYPGLSVEWPGFNQKRFGGILSIDGDTAVVQASNAKITKKLVDLTPRPDVTDPITQDQIETYGPKSGWKGYNYCAPSDQTIDAYDGGEYPKQNLSCFV